MRKPRKSMRLMIYCGEGTAKLSRMCQKAGKDEREKMIEASMNLE